MCVMQTSCGVSTEQGLKWRCVSCALSLSRFLEAECVFFHFGNYMQVSFDRSRRMKERKKVKPQPTNARMKERMCVRERERKGGGGGRERTNLRRERGGERGGGKRANVKERERERRREHASRRGRGGPPFSILRGSRGVCGEVLEEDNNNSDVVRR